MTTNGSLSASGYRTKKQRTEERLEVALVVEKQAPREMGIATTRVVNPVVPTAQSINLAARLYSVAMKSRKSLSAFVSAHARMEDGKPFSFHRHAYLRDVYADESPIIVIEKASQLGITSYAVWRALWGCWSGLYPKGVIVYFPTDAAISDLVKSRVDPILKYNQYLLGAAKTDAVGIKSIGGSHVYFRGLNSIVQALSLPADLLIFDEASSIPTANLDLSRQRLAHSELRHELWLGIPGMPGLGIDAEFQKTDMREYLIPCCRCHRLNDLVKAFPGCLVEREGKVLRVCGGCGESLETEITKGVWTPAEEPGGPGRGYRISQLHSEILPMSEILAKFRDSNTRMDNFYRGFLGLPYVLHSDKLDLGQVRACCDTAGMESSSAEDTYLGADIGKQIHWVVMAGNRVIAFGAAADFGGLDDVMVRYRVRGAVVDALPETHAVMDFANRHPRRVWKCFYSETAKNTLGWAEKVGTEGEELVVTAHRTWLHDKVASCVVKREIVFPRWDLCEEEFAPHLVALVRSSEKDEETGDVKNRYVRLSADHYRHALGYAIAAASAPSNPWSERTLIGEARF